MVPILKCFEVISGLRINFSKSSILGASIEDTSLHHYATLLGCRADSFPSTYLGLLLCLDRVPKYVWNPVIDRIKEKAIFLESKVFILGRQNCVDPISTYQPIYYMSILKCPIAIINRIEKLQRDFLRQGRDGSKKFHLVNCKTVCCPKDSGGLGIRPLRIMNQALLGKWLWRQPLEKHPGSQIQSAKKCLGDLSSAKMLKFLERDIQLQSSFYPIHPLQRWQWRETFLLA